MGYLTQYGSPLGAAIETLGNIYFVAPAASYTIGGPRGSLTYSASDDNDGLSPERALLTIARAIVLATASQGDVIAMLPGIHTVTGALAASKAGLTFVGLPYNPTHVHGTRARPSHRPQAIILQGTAATNGIAVTAADNTFVNLCLRSITQGSAMTFTTAADRLTVRDCMIDLKTPAGHANTKGIIASGATQAPTGLTIANNLFITGVITTSPGIGLEVGAAINFAVEGNTFLNDGSVASAVAWTTAVQCQDNCQGVFRDNDFLGSGVAITNGVRGVTHTGATIVQFLGNRFSVLMTNPITAWAAGDVDLGLNYVATVSGGTGGTLVSVST
jgi:hypothetical protein